jgi:hypothetical protein
MIRGERGRRGERREEGRRERRGGGGGGEEGGRGGRRRGIARSLSPLISPSPLPLPPLLY